MKILKIMQALLVTGALLMNTSCKAVEAKEITVEIDGQAIAFDVEPQIIDGRTMVPLRKIFEELGALVKWDGETQTVSAKKSSKAVSFTLNSNDMQLDSGKTDADGNNIVETVTLDVPAQLADDRTLVPLRAISEAFGLEVEWNDETSTVTIYSTDTTDESWKENIAEINLDNMTYTGEGVSVDGSKIIITKGGDFTVSGTTTGSITVNTEERVKLRLDNANITSAGEPCIYFENTDKAFITIENDTKNSLVSTDCTDGAIYSKENLEIKGSGTLDIKSDAGHGIKASDNLTIEEGTININAANDGININDTFKMTGGDVTVEAVCDGIASDSIVIIEGGNLDIKTTAEPINTSETSNNTVEGQDVNTQRQGGFMEQKPSAEFESSAKGIKAEWMMVISGGNITANTTDHAVHCGDEIEISGGTLSLNSAYGKGISGHGNVTIDGEDTVIDITKSTEGIESKKVLTINNGDISVIASDDTLNGTGGSTTELGNNTMRPENGQMGGTPPTDGENTAPTRGMNGDFTPPTDGENTAPARGMNGDFTPPTDGENTAPARGMNGDFTPPTDGENTVPIKTGGGMGGQMPGGKGGNQKDTIIINGGKIELNAGDDCIDANGNIVLNGGVINATHSSGAVVSFTGVLDADGSITIKDGVTIVSATRSGGIPTLSDTQNAVMIYTDASHNAGEIISIKDSNNEVIAEYTPTGSFQTVFAVLPQFEKDKAYTVTIGTETHDITMTGGVVTVGTAANDGFGSRGMGGGMGGGRGNRNQQTLPSQQ